MVVVTSGNTSDLVGLWNSRAKGSSNPFLSTSPRSRSRSPCGSSSELNSSPRKTSAQEMYRSHDLNRNDINKDWSHRKTSALVLMPDSGNRPNDLQILTKDHKSVSSIDVSRCSSLEVTNSPLRKTSSPPASSSTTTTAMPLKSSLKPTSNPAFKTSDIPTVVTSPPPTSSMEPSQPGSIRRGSCLGRSKSVKCQRVKFGPEVDRSLRYNDLSCDASGMNSRMESPKRENPFDKFKRLDQESQHPSGCRLQRQASLPSVKQLPAAEQPSGSGKMAVQRPIVAKSASSTKDLILSWVQQRTNHYPNVNVTNFSTSWNDGLAFCALIHFYYPEAFDFNELDPKNRQYNFELAFKSAEEYGDICPLLDVEDMVMMTKPDWKCVFTYVLSFYRRFRNGREPVASPPVRATLRSHDSEDKDDQTD